MCSVAELLRVTLLPPFGMNGPLQRLDSCNGPFMLKEAAAPQYVP